MAVNLGFTPQEMGWAKRIYHENGGWTPKVAEQIMGTHNFMQGSDIVKYCVKLMEDEMFQDALNYLTREPVFNDIPLEELNIVAKHYERMGKKFNRAGKWWYNDDFARLGIREPSIMTVFRDLEGPYEIYNQGKFNDGSDRYKLIKKGTKDVIIETKRHPIVQKEKELQSEQASIELVPGTNDLYNVKIKTTYAGLISRFAVMVSIKPPSFHCGMTVTINSAGNKIYIYALELPNDLRFDRKIDNRLGQWNNATTVIGYGYQAKELEPLLIKTTNFLKQYVDPRITIIVRPEHVFEEKVEWLVPKEEDDQFLDEGGDLF